MKRFLTPILLLTLLFPTLAFGETMNDLVKRDGLFYKKFTEVPFTGKITGNNTRGFLRNGKRDGPWMSYHENGQLWIKESYKDGKKDGPIVRYCSNRQLGHKGTYKNGKKDGPIIGYHCDGGIKVKGSYEDGKKDGPWVQYLKSGHVSEKGSYTDGKKDGPWISYHDNGQLNYKGTYKKGKKEGPWVSYHDNGGLADNDHYRDGQPESIIKLAKMVKQQLEGCWSPPAGAKDALSIRIRLRLKRDGSLLGSPRVVDRMRFGTDRSFRVFAESAIRAVNRCSPLNLPAEHYKSWKDITLLFDPSAALEP